MRCVIVAAITDRGLLGLVRLACGHARIISGYRAARWARRRRHSETDMILYATNAVLYGNMTEYG